MRDPLDRAAPWFLFAASLMVLLWGARTQGMVRDEAYYFHAAEQYSRFPLDLAKGMSLREAVQRDFSYNAEHPALMKLLYGFSWRLLAGHFGIGEILAFRIPALLLAAWLTVLLYQFGRALGSRLAGGLAALLALLEPHLFFHAQLACFDVPVMVFWVAVVYAYYRSLSAPSTGLCTRWAILCGVLFGLSQSIKFTTVFLPPVLLLHWLYCRVRRGRPPVAPLAGMALGGPVVFFVLWPWLWFDPVGKLRAYFSFHFHHWHYNFEFLGRNYNHPPYPWTVPWVETALTVPLTTLVLALATLACVLLRKPIVPDQSVVPGARPVALLVANILAPLLVLNLPDAPIFGGVKHTLAAVPFLALAGALGLARLRQAWVPHIRAALEPWAAAALVACVLVPSALAVAYSHPYGISYYNALAGGFAGGADLGMNRQFWGYAPRELLPWLNRNVPPSSRVYFHDLNIGSFEYYKRSALLRPDIQYAGLEDAAIRASDTALVIHEKHFNYYEYLIWQHYGTTKPVKILEREGVPLVTVYQRDRPGK